MLHQLVIRNFAIIDQLQVDWQPGLNVITGETGAGKSIIIDAVGALLGDRLGPEVVRSGADRALIEGVFSVDGQADLAAILEEYGLEPEDGALIVSREVAGSGGRGGGRVNGRSVPLAVLQELGEQLVDIHGQSQHMALLRPREQLDYLDRFAGVLPERSALIALTKELRAAREAQRQLLAEEREAARLQDVLQHELAEIERAELQPDEEERLQAQRRRLEHVERLRQAAETAYAALNGQPAEAGDLPGAIDLLGEAVSACGDGGRFDPVLASEAEVLSGVLSQAEESSRMLRDYVDSLEADPAALEHTAARLFRIADLKRKYGDTVDEVLAYAENARRRLDELEHRADRLSELEAQSEQLLVQARSAAVGLAERRRAAATELATLVERELADLRLAGTRFCVAVEVSTGPDGVPQDEVEFRLAAGSDDEPRAISRVASGGELARIALALKTTLARAETRPTLIFDEIDMGVGGRTAPVVGSKLWHVAAAGHQVLCVTHMAQVAAYADHHLAVTRSDGAVRISTLDRSARVDELAAMLAGAATDAARKNARELLARAAGAKASS
ncbi:MAG TPA: DNA repair protein RecN [Chloroflexota bacterium]|nr:DNA repair protein RecN [Chloroflexota bacterium]